MHVHTLHARPRTTLGRWAIGLAIAFVVLNLLWQLLPGGAALALACGLAGGVAAAVAVVRDGERGLFVYAAIVPLLAVVGFVAAELLIGHD